MTIIDKIRHNVDIITNRYFLDMQTLKLQGNVSVENWNILSSFFAYLLKKSVLITGEPGWGKTTLSSIIGSASLGLPIDLLRSLVIHGHPDQTFETMLARPDYGELLAKIEKAVWQNTLFFPFVQIDEFNRLPKSKQSELLDLMASSRVSYLNQTFFDGDKSFFATVNYKEGAVEGQNLGMDVAILDRFAISFELGYFQSLYSQII